jgi:asparagine synthase (glutamine-hydrolysing)
MFYYSGIFSQNKKNLRKEFLISMFNDKEKDNPFLFFFKKCNFGFKEAHKNKILKSIYKTDKAEIVVFFEGRISNINEFSHLFKKLESKKIKYSDLILEIYRKKGYDYFSKLRGGFSFVIYDTIKDKLILYRDKIGIKPLYYFYKNETFLFSSLIKPIIRSGLVKKEINEKYIYNFFHLRALNNGQDTEYKNVYMVKPGELIVFEKKTVNKKDLKEKNQFLLREEQEVIEEKLYEITKKEMESFFSSYKKIAIAFSGGLDTNVILNFALKNKMPIETFTVKFKTKAKIKNIDYELAKKRSQRYGIKHHKINLTPDIFLENFEERVKSFDRLTAINFLNNESIFEFVSRQSDNVFTGDGIEEQLGFYPWVTPPYYADLLLNTYRSSYKKNHDVFFEAVLKDFFNFNEGDGLALDTFKKEFINKINSYNYVDYIKKCVKSLEAEKENFVNLGILNKIFNMFFDNILMPTKSIASDFISRKYSIDICAPYIEENFVLFLNKLSSNLKYRGNYHENSKYIFRKAMSKLIGDKEAFNSFKSGSDLPYTEWLLEPVFEKKIKEILSPERIEKNNIINKKEVEKILKEHFENKELFDRGVHILFKKGIDHQSAIISLISFQLWWEENFNN